MVIQEEEEKDLGLEKMVFSFLLDSQNAPPSYAKKKGSLVFSRANKRGFDTSLSGRCSLQYMPLHSVLSLCGHRLYLTLAFSATHFLPFGFQRLLGMSLSFDFFMLALSFLHRRHKAKREPSTPSVKRTPFSFQVCNAERLN